MHILSAVASKASTLLKAFEALPLSVHILPEPSPVLSGAGIPTDRVEKENVKSVILGTHIPQ